VSSSLSRSAQALSDRIGANAKYSSFAPPALRKTEPPTGPGRFTILRLLWLASLALFLLVLIVAALVALDV
jgi:hypothetical protein